MSSLDEKGVPYQAVEILASRAPVRDDAGKHLSMEEGRRVRGANGYNEALFSAIRLEEFVPANHPLRPVRTWLNEALTCMDARFSAMYGADVKGDGLIELLRTQEASVQSEPELFQTG